MPLVTTESFRTGSPSGNCVVSSPWIQASLVALLFTSGFAQAQSVWDAGGTDTNWSTAANWVGDTIPASATTTDVELGGSGSLSSNVDTAYTLRTLKFTSGSFTLTGSEISLQGNGSGSADLLLNFTSSSGSAFSQTIDNSLKLLGSGAIRTVNSNLTLNGGLNLNGVSQVQLNANAGRTLTINGVISGSTTNLFFTGHSSGTGSILLNAQNTYTGKTTIWTAGVTIGVDALITGGAFGVGTSEIFMGVNASGTFTPSLLTGAAVTMARDVRVVTNTSGTQTATLGGSTAHTSTYSGNITLGTDSAAGAALTLTSASGGRVNITGNLLRATGATGTTDAITKTGAGIVALSGTNTYSGATAVNVGTLLINGSLSGGGGAVTVASAATLGGSGTINRDVSILDGASFTPGDFNSSGVSQAGTLTVSGALTFADTSSLYFDLGSSSDLVSVTGNLTLDGVLNLTAGSGFGAGTYQLFSFTGTLFNNTLTLGTVPSGYSYALDFTTANQVNLIVTSSAVPEPASAAVLMGAAALVGVACIRRRSRS